MDYIIHYDIAALFISITVLIHFFYKKTINTRQTQMFSVIILLALISNVMDLVTVYIISNPGTVSLECNMFLNGLYQVLFHAIPAAYLAYMVIVTNDRRRMSRFQMIWICLPICVIVLLILTTLNQGWIFYFDAEGNYVRGTYFYILYISAFYYMGSSFLQTRIHQAKLTKGQAATIYFYTASNLIAMLIQMAVPSLMLVQFLVALSVLMIYLTLENPEDYMDKQLGTYNNVAFIEVFESNVHLEKKFNVLGVQIEGLKYINDTMGVGVGNSIMKEIADFLLENTRHQRVYHMSGARFIIMGSEQDEEWREISHKIHDRFRNAFKMGEIELSLSVSMCILNYPDSVERLEDAMDMIDYSLGIAKSSGNEIVVYADREILERGRRENMILQAIHEAVANSSFEVYYQPIYSVKEKRFTTAEALIRLKHEQFGFISPEEFIPIAEKNGYILDIGNMVFRKVCCFYKEHNLQKLGIDYIHVNLSVVECMQEKLYEKLIDTMDAFALPYHRIQLEITETAAVASKEILYNNMEKLIDVGMEFSMDDYGTGFSNTATIINYPFSSIKLDKSMVWSAMEDEKAMIALKHSIAMIKDLKLSIVAEGVETLSQVNRLTVLGCDFFQGYYFSKPLPGEAFVAKIREQG